MFPLPRGGLRGLVAGASAGEVGQATGARQAHPSRGYENREPSGVGGGSNRWDASSLGSAQRALAPATQRSKRPESRAGGTPSLRPTAELGGHRPPRPQTDQVQLRQAPPGPRRLYCAWC